MVLSLTSTPDIKAVTLSLPPSFASCQSPHLSYPVVFASDSNKLSWSFLLNPS